MKKIKIKIKKTQTLQGTERLLQVFKVKFWAKIIFLCNIYLFIYLSIYFFIHLFIYLFIYLPIYSLIYLW